MSESGSDTKRNRVIISLRDASFSFDGQPVLEHISLDVNEGDYLGVIGPNGGGKTTLIRLMLGLIQPTSGAVDLFGRPVNSFRDWSSVGYIPQKATHIESRFPFSVQEVVSLGRVAKAGMFRRLRPVDREAVLRTLEQVNMLPYRERLITELSGGQQQRVFIAKALVSDPGLLILDEPTVGVDVDSQNEFYSLLSRLNSEQGITLVVVSHDIDVIAKEVNSLSCVNQSLIFHGDPAECCQGDYLNKLYGQAQKIILHGH